MPSIDDARRLLKRLDFASDHVAAIEKEIVAERKSRRGAIVAAVRAEAASLFDNSLPASDTRLAALERTRSEHATRFAAIREEHWELRRGVIRGNFKDKLAALVVEHSRSALPRHRAAIAGWNGSSVSDLMDLYLDYFADCMAVGMDHGEAISGISGGFVLDGELVPLAELAAKEDAPCVASDEDGNMLQMRQWSVRVVPLSKIEASDGGSVDDLLERVAQMQESLLDPVLSEIMRGVRDNGGAGTWFRSEMLAIEAFRPDWHYRTSQLATHLANALFLELGATCGRIDRRLAETGLIENPYVRVGAGRSAGRSNNASQ